MRPILCAMASCWSGLLGQVRLRRLSSLSAAANSLKCPGKTTICECLMTALTELGTKHIIWRMNPKADSLELEFST